MERPPYDRSLRHGACPGPSPFGPGHTTARPQYDGARHALAGSMDAGAARRESAVPYPHGAPAARRSSQPPQSLPPVLSQKADPMVQMDNQLTKNSSRKVHCYISQTHEDDDLASGEQMPPPVLPPASSLAASREIPFWRPPRVLQREPHYSSLGAEPAPGTAGHRESPSVAPESHGKRGPLLGTEEEGHSRKGSGTGPSLSSALLAISNSHYEEQMRQDDEPRQQASTSGSSPEAQRPTIQPLLSSPTLSDSAFAEAARLSSRYGKSHMGSNGFCIASQASESDGSLLSDDTNDAAACACCITAGTIHGAKLSGEPGPRLPPIAAVSDTRHVATSRPGGPPVVSLPGIYSLAPGPFGVEVQPDIPDGSAHHSPQSRRKRVYGEKNAVMALQKVARTEDAPCATADHREAGQATVSSLHPLQQFPLCPSNQVVITCYHAAVAQKSYGGEKRFLCPPPAVLMHGSGPSAQVAHHSAMMLSVITDVNAHSTPASQKRGGSGQSAGLGSMAGLPGTKRGSDSGSSDGTRPSSSSHAPLECQTSFNERNVALFKSLHVTGMQKAKSFRLRLDLLAPSGIAGQLRGHHEHRPWQAPEAFASLESGPVAIISKPSKKTAKARNQSSCIREGSLISLFNRINSQTFRTKYLNVDHHTNRWVAQSHNWSPLEVVVLSENRSSDSCSPRRSGTGSRQPENSDSSPLYYGSEIVLIESRRNFRSPPMIIHKVERGRLVENACSPVSQMQKIALQERPSRASDPPRYLMADAGHYNPVSSDGNSPTRFDDPDGSPELTFEPLQGSSGLSRARSRERNPAAGGVELDDAFCWTIVGISGFTYAYSVPAEPPAAAHNIGPIPHVADASLDTEGSLGLVMPGFDCSCMQLMLNRRPLEISRCNTAKRSRPADRALVPGNLFTAKLPADAKPGALSIRRADGVQYHAKWAIKREGRLLELIACNLNI